MTLTPFSVATDSTDPLPLARWWSEQVGGTITAENDGWFVVVEVPGHPNLAFQKVEATTPGKNRLHIDFTTPDVEAEVARLTDAGATVFANHEISGFPWVVLTDPDGNQFCVSRAQ